MEDLTLYDIPKIRVDKTPRPQQIELLEFTKKSILSNKKFTYIDAPTGSGKSTYAVMVMDWFKKEYDRTAQFDVLTHSKILQEQYTNEFDFMQSLWGKNSYRCEKYDTDCGIGMEWCKIQNTQCDECPYQLAKARFEMSDVALTNFHLFLTYMIYMPMAWKRHSNVLIIDEIHLFEEVLADFITTKISKPILKRNGFTDEEIIKALNVFGNDSTNLTDIEFITIINEKFLPIVKSVINRLSTEIKESHNKQISKQLQSLSNNFLKWNILYDEYNKLPNNWVIEIETIEKYNNVGKVIDKYIEYTAQPVWSYPYLMEKVWSKYDYVILMSGTILDKQLFSKINGIDENDAEYISIPTVFPVENRPIYYFHNTGKQSYKTKHIVWPKQKAILEKIIKKHKKDKGIIHTGNYEIQRWIQDQINDHRLLCHNTENRSETLQQHFNTNEATILVSPSLITGIDLNGDLSRHQTIIKIPYPNLGSKKIKKRLETIPEWYTWKTVCDIIQAYGRSIRSKDDKASTYIIDSCFGDILKWGNKYMLKWVKDAIHYID